MIRLHGWHVQKRILLWHVLHSGENNRLLPVHVSTHNKVLRNSLRLCLFPKEQTSQKHMTS